MKKNNDAAMNTAFKIKSDAAGQGTDNPKESIWADHAVIEYGGKVYDPSYGLEYGIKAGALFQFMSQSVESFGVCTPLPIGVSIDGYGITYQKLITGNELIAACVLDPLTIHYYFRWL